MSHCQLTGLWVWRLCHRMNANEWYMVTSHAFVRDLRKSKEIKDGIPKGFKAKQLPAGWSNPLYLDFVHPLVFNGVLCFGNRQSTDRDPFLSNNVPLITVPWPTSNRNFFEKQPHDTRLVLYHYVMQWESNCNCTTCWAIRVSNPKGGKNFLFIPKRPNRFGCPLSFYSVGTGVVVY